MKNKPFDLSTLKRVEARRRQSLVHAKGFARPSKRTDSAAAFMRNLPDFLKASDWRTLMEAIVRARKNGKPILWMMGAHVLKCGLSPVLLDLMKHGLVDVIAFNGAGAIHDIEIAHLGYTSEDVAAGLETGEFGMARDTAVWYADGATWAAKHGIGLGEGMGHSILASKARNKRLSLFAQAVKLNIPVLTFPAIGAEIIAQHPEYDGAQIGAAGHRDFCILAEQCRRLNNGGVVLLFGSAVILPEVFLKALTVARNRYTVRNFTTANFDMIQHYRPNVNVVNRPTRASGTGLSFTGHHELMLPLLAWSIKGALKL